MKKNIVYYDVPQISSVQDMLIKTAKTHSGKTALEDLTDTPIGKVTYKQLLDNVLRFGNALKKLGLTEREHIAIIGENRVQWGIAYLAVMAFNFVVVPIDKNLTVNEILNILYESDSAAIVFSESFHSMMEERKSVLKKLRFFISMDIEHEDGEFYSMPEMISKSKPSDINKLPKINPNEMAEIIFTSGSVGRAKGVMLSQSNLASNLMSMTSMIELLPEDRFLSVLPIHHTYECTCGLLCPLSTGSSVHYARSLKTIVEDMQKVKPTIFLAVPLLYEKMYHRITKTISEDKIKSRIVPPLLKVTQILQKAGLKNIKKKIFKELHHRFGGAIRIFIAGGAAPDPEVAKGLREFGFTFIQGYGLTETSPILALNQLDNFKDNAAGIPLPKVEININDPDADGIGEVFAKGPNIMLGYYKNSSLTEESFEDGWFKTGDFGFMDEDGFLHISGRKKNVIIANNGKNVFPEEIEDILNRSPFIMESMVYGEKNEKHDEIIAAQIVIDAEAFIEYSENNSVTLNNELVHKIISGEVKSTNKELASYKQIKKFYVRDKEFEKTTTQKIKRYLINTSMEEDKN
jgi:long-chain acyl-CoA synthetase